MPTRPLILPAIACLLVSCQTAPPLAQSPGANSQISSEELRSILSDMARSHQQKIELALYANFPFFSVDKPFQPFYANMGKVQGELLEQLRTWADRHQFVLTYILTNDTSGHALTIMEDRQEKLIRSDDRAGPDFPRDTLMQMYTDYEWQISLIQALLPSVTDPALRQYLQNSLKAHEAGSAEIMALLKRYKFSN